MSYKIELKSLKINLTFSEETTMFQANLYVDGKHVGFASNDGRGGNTHIMGRSSNDNDLIRKVDEWCKSLPEKKYDGLEGLEGTYPQSLETVVDDLVYEEVKKKDEKSLQTKLKNKMKKSILITDDKEGETLKSYSELGWKNYTIEQLLQQEVGRNMIKNAIQQQKNKGKRVLNTNIPKELM